MAIITFKPKQITKKLIAALPERPRFVIINRFGLDGPEKMTLEAIGGTYGITRERVRQIENFGLNAIKKSSVFQKEQPVFNELAQLVTSLGGVVSEEDFLEYISKNVKTQNHINLLLVLGDDFKKEKENKEFKYRWSVDNDITLKVQESLDNLSKELSIDDLIPEGEMVANFLNHLQDIPEQYKDEEIIKRWLGLSKIIGRNPLNDWGMAKSSNINARGIRDYAFLVIRRHGSPMHFTEVANSITEIFDRKAHTATCHNELIKDKRFVLVGRGLYALKDWGYEKGVVREVIKNILKKDGPLTKDEIIKRVLKERYVKENTIAVNLQDTKIFSKDRKGRYKIV